MTFSIEVNTKKIEAKRGETILETLRNNGIKIPTLCRLKDLSPTGACRLCVVEVEGQENLIPACSYPVEEWMKIKTHSPRVINARKTIVELLLAGHPDDCLFCDRNLKCELQKLAEELNIRERGRSIEKPILKLDLSSPGIIRDPSKCILCGRCIRVCEEQQNVATLDFVGRGRKIHVGTSFNRDLNFTNCILCGQCILYCPTSALHEKTSIEEVQEAIHNENQIVVAQYAPSVSVTIAEEFGFKPGKDINGILNAVLRRIGFDFVFDTSFAADVAIMEESAELLTHLEKNSEVPLFNACCPAWVKYAEQYLPELLPHLSTTKSPQQLLGALIKTDFANKKSIKSDKIFSVGIMPCTAKKYEAQREEMTRKAISDVDAVITTRELAKLIKLYGIDVHSIEPETPDAPYGQRSSAGKLLGVGGGLTESLVRNVFFMLGEKDFKKANLVKLKGSEGFRIVEVKVEDRMLNFAIVSGLQYLPKLLDELRLKKTRIDFVEIMACPGGCINGGGQPIESVEGSIKMRAKALYDIDLKETIRYAYKNPFVTELYERLLEKPGSEKSKSLLHTAYHFKEVL